jgi:adenine-specific DNA-methyltransferase
MQELLEKGLVLFGEDETTVPNRKYFLKENLTESVASLFYMGGSDDDSFINVGLTFDNPKPVKVGEYFISIIGRPKESLVLDYFAGSGTTSHAVINLNREDGGKRKYILVEMGEHFNTVLKPRIQKVVYSADWKDGKPTAPESGISHCFKYIRLESYEDTLNNLELKDQSKNLDLFAASATATDADKLKNDYLLRYMLDVESKGSLLSVEDFRKPFDYHLRVAADSAGAWEERKIDLVETFNYLIGLRVKHVHSDFERGFVYVEGTLPSGEKTLVLWRDCEKLSYDELNKLCGTLSLNPKDSEYSIIYVNGDHTIPTQTQELESEGGVIRELKVRQIEPEFLSRMFATQE